MSSNTLKMKTKNNSEPGFVDSMAEFFSNHSFLAIVFGFIILVLFD